MRAPALEVNTPSAVRVVSAAKMTEAAQHLERFLFRLHEGWRIRPDSAECITPLRAGRTLGVKAEGRWIEEDALAFDLLDHGSLGKNILERKPGGETALHELEAAELRERVVAVPQQDSNPVLGAQIAKEDRDDQGIGFIARHLHEARCGKVGRLSLPRVSEVLHLEQAARMRAGDPRPIAAPGSSTRKGFELIVQTLQQVIV